MIVKEIQVKAYEVLIVILCALTLFLGCLSIFYLNKYKLEKSLHEKAVADLSLYKVKAELELEKKQSKINLISSEYENEKAKVKIRVEEVTKEVQKIIERPVYTNICTDNDGLQSINSLISKSSK